ncbi:ferredoxin family protein [Halanaerobium sp. MA284_MarDTE_T2]|uniref:4Fe-4S dicluster domain-containing protein n=1 Tax=Halanaerobium sp. MA284_MarDTE_T2 TaxID=2183913 RepID=UPI000DF33D60|nr:4Fe-4S dicluster domain-containing protein [Halanaerobium sp. MA284_MarDTE_T2]RCW44387.1 2-oxoglutarate ferredoxin oxidoreductase subunit delta [Halanaerobium sp. MA284_MarDTE_T2]
MIYIKKDMCKGCGLCIEFCPVNILKFSEDLNEKGVYPPEVTDINKCIECENCMIYCPDFAIFLEKGGVKNEK